MTIVIFSISRFQINDTIIWLYKDCYEEVSSRASRISLEGVLSLKLTHTCTRTLAHMRTRTHLLTSLAYPSLARLMNTRSSFSTVGVARLLDQVNCRSKKGSSIRARLSMALLNFSASLAQKGSLFLS
jgi:hypothetical protein